MNMNEYQRFAARTGAKATKRWTRSKALSNATIGLCGESGEVAELIKKSEFHDRPYTLDDIAGELGDVLWYLSELATLHGIDLDTIASANIAKLMDRYPVDR